MSGLFLLSVTSAEFHSRVTPPTICDIIWLVGVSCNQEFNSSNLDASEYIVLACHI